MKKPKLIQKQELARLKKVTPSAVSKWVAEGLPSTPHGIDLAAAETWLAEHHPERVNESKPAAADSFSEARRRRELANAELKEHELAVARGEYLPAAEVIAEWQKLILSARNRMLRIPAELSDVIAAETSPSKCLRLMEDRIREALSEMANYGGSNEGDRHAE